MSMDLCAHVKVDENKYEFAPYSDFDGIDFVDDEYPSICLTMPFRKILSEVGVNFYEESKEDGFITLTQARAEEITTKIKFLIDISFLEPEYHDYALALYQFFAMATSNNYQLSMI